MATSAPTKHRVWQRPSVPCLATCKRKGRITPALLLDACCLLADLGRRADAAGTDVQARCDAGERHLLDLDVGFEGPVGARRLTLPAPGVVVPNITTEGRALTADVTCCSHSLNKLPEPRT